MTGMASVLKLIELGMHVLIQSYNIMLYLAVGALFGHTDAHTQTCAKDAALFQ